MNKFDVYAGWTDERIGSCRIEKARGKETIAFMYDSEWLICHPDIFLDPDLYQTAGFQYPPQGKSCFGFLSDTAPDRWGRKLMDKRERLLAKNENRPARTLLESDYILGVHDGGRQGAIRLKDSETGVFLSSEEILSIPPMERIRELEHAAISLEQNAEEEKWIHTLFAPGSSLGGARPKANIIDENGDLWIAKFPSKNDDIDVGAWEMVASNLAKSCGILTPETKIMRLSDNGSTFLSKRFDRKNGERIHFASAMTMLGKTDGEEAGYLDIVSAVEQLSGQCISDLTQLFTRAAFNICISNTDDHLRNHGFLLSDGYWTLSPAYDMNPDIEKIEMSLYIGDTNEKSLSNLLALSEYFRINKDNALDMIAKIQETVAKNWEYEAKKLRIPRKEIDLMRPAFDKASEVVKKTTLEMCEMQPEQLLGTGESNREEYNEPAHRLDKEIQINIPSQGDKR